MSALTKEQLRDLCNGNGPSWNWENKRDMLHTLYALMLRVEKLEKEARP